MPVVRSSTGVLPAALIDVALALTAAALAFALDARGGTGIFAFGAASFFLLQLSTAWFSIRGLRKGDGVADLPDDAVVRDDAAWISILRHAAFSVSFVALATAVLGTLGAGMALGSILGGVFSALIVRRWTDSRGIETFGPETPWWKPWGPKDQPWVYVRRTGRAGSGA